MERYGKKYGWIAYHEMLGCLPDAGRAPAPFGDAERLMPDIDPTFPDRPPLAPRSLPSWAPAEPTDDQTWLTSGRVTVPDQLWSPEEIHGVDGGWLLVEGYLDHRSGEEGRFGGEQVQQGLALVGLGSGQDEDDGQALEGAHQVQPKAPEEAAAAGAVPVLGPSGQVGAFDSLA